MSENKADNRSGINQLPEECHREVHSGCLDPYSNELISSILKKNGSSKAHKRTHKSNRWNGDRKYHTERMAGSEINHAGSTCKSKFGYEEEVKNECDWSHYDQFMPPALVAVVVSMVMLPLSSNKLLIMDPFVDPEDVDLEMMRYRPNGWPMIPMFIELVMRNGRVPKDYDMSHLLAAGAGCEAVNNNQLDRVQNFLEEHNCHVRFTVGYGSSEGGSNLTFQMAPKSIHNGNVGIPMPLTDMSVFKPGTQEELGYNEMGEICASGPGIMLGYDRRSATAKALQTHADGKLWLHTGDIGYVDEDGIFYVLNRGAAFRYGGGELAVLPMENRLADAKIPGIRDEFFVLIEDEDHDGYFVPYLYVVLEDGYSVDDIIDDVQSCLEPYMFPVEILAIDERPFFHFKTNRIELSKELKKRKYDC